MTGIAITLLFGSAFIAAAWTLCASIRPQLHRFEALFGPVPALPALPPRLGRVTVRAIPAPMPVWGPLRAAA
jgi:hypothetical protein